MYCSLLLFYKAINLLLIKNLHTRVIFKYLRFKQLTFLNNPHKEIQSAVTSSSACAYHYDISWKIFVWSSRKHQKFKSTKQNTWLCIFSKKCIDLHTKKDLLSQHKILFSAYNIQNLSFPPPLNSLARHFILVK